MSRILVTGANKGLGYEASRRLIEAGHDVWMAARDPERGREAAADLGGRFVQLDVTSDGSAAAAAEVVGDLDVLVNNAGIDLGRYDGSDTAADLEEVYATNVFGAVRVFRAFLPALGRAVNPVVVNVSSGLGSFTRAFDPSTDEGKVVCVGYASSKSALTMVSVQWSKAFPEMRINVADPGYTATDLNGNSGHQTVTEGTDAIVALATIGPDGPTGACLDRYGPVPW